MLARFRHWLKARPGDYLLIRTADDVLRAKESGRLGVFSISRARTACERLLIEGFTTT